MRIQPIYSYYELHDKTNVMSCPQMPEDTFVKSSSFKGYRMIPFLEGEISYTEKNLKQFNQNIYEEKGILDIDDFEYILDCKESDKIINMKFNIVGETIGHLLVDYYPNSNNPQEINRLEKIVRTINSKGFDFQAKDEFGKTPLDKAEEAENDMMKTLLQRYY